MHRGASAGQVVPTRFTDDLSEHELRVAFDFDGVVADDAAERIYQRDGIDAFRRAERANAAIPMAEGPLHRFLTELAKLQQRERNRACADPTYPPRLRIAIVTARNAPAHERVVTSLREWGIQVDEVFFLGGIEKSRILAEFRPHIYFDDQRGHIEGAADIAPCAHVPFGVVNEAATEMIRRANELG
jgi:5'-nucleotidase